MQSLTLPRSAGLSLFALCPVTGALGPAGAYGT